MNVTVAKVREMKPGRSVQLPLWLVGVGILLVGSLIGTVITLAVTQSTSNDVAPAAVATPSPEVHELAGATTGKPRPSTAPLMPSERPSPSATATAEPEPAEEPTLDTPEVVAPPHGSLTLLSAGDGPQYGQSFPDGRCANWTIGLINQSDTPITEVTFAPPSAAYTNYGGWDGEDFPEIAANIPEPVVLEIYLPPGETQDVRFQTCTSTPVPDDPNFEFGVEAPEMVAFRWISGHTGEACFRC